MRVFCASIATETNTFSPLRCDFADFAECFYAPPGDHPETPTLCSAVFTEARKRAIAGEIDLVEGTACWAEPSGLINRETWKRLRDEVLGQLRAAMPVEVVLLGLHGAMIVDGCIDPEGELIARTRQIAGPDAKIGVTFDPHSHLSDARVENADIVTVFKEFPHTDFVRTGADCVRLTLAAARGEISPEIAVFDVRMIDVMQTSVQPMRDFVDKMLATEATGEALSLSLIHGFMAGDSPNLGAKMIAITDGDQGQAQKLAGELGREVFGFRGRAHSPFLSPDEALDQALAESKGLVVVADIWDNPGGGVAGDSTILLNRLLKRGIQNVALAPLWDPMAVRLCHAAGEGAVIPLRFGGKTSAHAGPPIDAEVVVLKTQQSAQQSFGESIVPLGNSATIRTAGVEVVLTTNRAQAFAPDLFSNNGIDPLTKTILIVKSTNHFHAAFAPIASSVVYASVDGPYPSDPTKNNYKNLTRAIWPIVENPFA